MIAGRGRACEKAGWRDDSWGDVDADKLEGIAEQRLFGRSPEGRAGDQFRWTKAYKEYLAHHPNNGGIFDFGGDKFEKEQDKYQVKWPSSMDGFSYLLAMNHSVELHINAVQAANQCQDLPISQAKEFLTPDLLEFKDLCPEIFTSENPMDLIMKHEKMLTGITGVVADNEVPIDISEF